MPLITYVHDDGSEDTVDVPVGESVMRGAVDNDIDGIVAECGGNAMCATCHVYVAEECLALLPPMREEEDEMLDNATCPRKENSRLSCQLRVTEDFDDFTVYLPEEQL